MGTSSLLLCWALLAQPAPSDLPDERYPSADEPAAVRSAAPPFSFDEGDDEIPDAPPDVESPRSQDDDRYAPREQREPAPRYEAPQYEAPEYEAAGEDEFEYRPAAPVDEPRDERPVVPVTPRANRDRPAELIREALVPPEIGSLPGQPLGLVDVLTRTADRPMQIAATLAYWQLSSALANYHHRLAEYQWLDALAARHESQLQAEEEALLRSNLAAAQARVHEAELAALDAQYDLASKLGWPPQESLPLPGDVPHVGVYRTLFDTLFADRPAPPHARLIDRTLPVRLRELVQRAAAVEAATDALEAAGEALAEHEVSLPTLLDCLATVRNERAALVATVHYYNADIAQYALGIAPLGMRQNELAGMLIKPRGAVEGESALAPGGPAVAAPARRDEVAPTGFEAPRWTAPRVESPNLAEPRLLPQAETRANGLRPGDVPWPEREPTLAPPRASQPAPANEPPIRIREPSGNPFGAPAPAAVDGAAAASGGTDRLANATPWQSYFRPEGEDDRLYSALIEVAPGKRAQRLTSWLHWDRGPQAAEAEACSLAECLERVGPSARREAIERFWQVRERAAARQLLAEQGERLEALAPLALELRTVPGGALSMLRLRAARLRAEAALLAADADLWYAQWELTQHLGSPLDGVWLLADTVPHGGGYNLKLESQPPAVAAQPAVRRLAQVVPGLHVVLREQAASIVATDEAYATALEACRAGRESLDAVLSLLERQQSETLNFLATLTAYNESIADYLLAVVGAEAPVDVLVPALVLSPTGRSPRDALPEGRG